MFVLKILPNMCESDERSCAMKVTSFPHEPCAPTPSASSVFLSLDKSVYASRETSQRRFGGKWKCRPCLGGVFWTCFLLTPSQIDRTSKTSLNTIWKSGASITVKFCLHSEVFILFVILLIYTLARGKKLSCLWVAPWGAIQGITLWLWNHRLALQFNYRQNERGLSHRSFHVCVVHAHVVCM